MDDELEKLLAELAEQERQRLRRKSNQQSNLAARNDRFCVNNENKIRKKRGILQLEKMQKDDALAY